MATIGSVVVCYAICRTENSKCVITEFITLPIINAHKLPIGLPVIISNIDVYARTPHWRIINKSIQTVAIFQTCTTSPTKITKIVTKVVAITVTS